MTETVSAASIVSLDSGSSYFKLFDGKTRLTPFPAAIHPVSAQLPHPDNEEIVVGGNRYLVGADALCEDNRLAAAPRTESDFHGSDEQAVQICYAFNKAGIHGMHDALVVSLPYDMATKLSFAQRREAIKARRTFSWSTREGAREAEFRKVHIVAQGVGAWNRYRMGNRSKVYECVVVADVGSCTLDIVTMRLADGRYRFSSPACGSLRAACSVGGFFTTWSSLLRQQNGLQARTFSYYQLMQNVMRDRLRLPHMGQDIDLRPTYDEARTAFTVQVKEAIEEAVGASLWPAVDRIILTGGGAKLLCIEAWRDPRIETMDSWANAEGQYHMIREMMPARPTVPGMQTVATNVEAAASAN